MVDLEMSFEISFILSIIILHICKIAPKLRPFETCFL